MDYPLPAYSYTVSFGASSFAFASVSGLALDFEIVPYKHGLSFQEGASLLVGAQSTIRLTMKRGIFRSGALSQFYQWISTNKPEQPATQDVTVSLCDSEGVPVTEWHASGCVPVRLEAPALAADRNEAAIETLELVALNLTMSFPQA